MKEFYSYGYADNILKLKELALQEDFSRQSVRENVSNQKDTRILVGLYDILYDVPGFMDKHFFYKYYDLLEDVIEKVKKTHNYKSIELLSLVMVKLNADGIIDKHCDENGYYRITHRIHIPLITSNKCTFFVGDESYSMKEGEIVEIDNTIPHSVTNGGADRVHLIMDILGFQHEFNEELLNTSIPDGFYIKE